MVYLLEMTFLAIAYDLFFCPLCIPSDLTNCLTKRKHGLVGSNTVQLQIYNTPIYWSNKRTIQYDFHGRAPEIPEYILLL